MVKKKILKKFYALFGTYLSPNIIVVRDLLGDFQSFFKYNFIGKTNICNRVKGLFKFILEVQMNNI